MPFLALMATLLLIATVAEPVTTQVPGRPRAGLPRVDLVFSRSPADRTTVDRLVILSGPDRDELELPRPRRAGDTEPTWSPSGRRIAFTRTERLGEDNWPASLWVIRADGRGAHPVAPYVGAWVAHLEPDWSPDGAWIAFRSIGGPAGTPATHIHVVHPDGSEMSTLLAPGGAPNWSPDGSSLAYVQWSTPDVTWGGGREIFRAASDGTGITRLTDDVADDFDPAWSPDGTRIAFVSDRSGNPDIWIMDADGTDLVQVTHHPAVDQDPTWSPDGGWLAFTSTRVAPDPLAYNATTDLFVIHPDGTGVQRITSTPDIERDPDWRPTSP